MNELRVEAMPSDLMDKLVEHECDKPNLCFANCSLAVLNHQISDTYVLCFAEDMKGDKHGHALIKINGNYYDRSLIRSDEKVNRYFLHSEMSRAELRAILKELMHVTSSGVHGYPLALLDDGSVACVKPNSWIDVGNS